MQKKIVRHKWKGITNQFKTDICENCGIVRRWEQSLQCYSYFKMWINGFPIQHIGYHATDCILINCTSVKPKIEI